MAMTYTGTGGIFTLSGKLIKAINAHNVDSVTTLPADLSSILAVFEAGGNSYMALIDGLVPQNTGFRDGVTQMRQSLAAWIDKVLNDPINVLPNLNVIDPTLATSVLPALVAQMIVDSKTIQKCVVTLGSVSTSGNGNGTALVTKVLDGYSAPIQGAPAIPQYNGLNSELAVTSETMELVCQSDSQRDGATEGQESFAWRGGIKYPNFDYNTEGSGDGPNVSCMDAATFITDGNFENWTNSTTPTNWTVDSGASAIAREDSTVYRGSHCLKLTGDGSTATIQVSQQPTLTSLKNKRRYCVAVRIRASAVPAAGNILVKFTGTGYAASSVTDEVQTLQISGTPTGGTYTISWVGPYGGTQTTATIAYNAASSAVQTALRALTGLESVVVTTAAGSPPDVTHSITFYGVPGPLNQITADITGLTGGSPAKAIATTTPGVEGEQINLPATAFPLANTWVLRWFWINLPAVIPSDFKLTVAVGSTLSNAAVVRFDSLGFDDVKYHGGVGVVIPPGSTRFLDGDILSWTVANDNGGVFQTAFRRAYQVQLPSSSGGGVNISDGLAT